MLNLSPVTLGYVTSSLDKRQRGGDCIYTDRSLLSLLWTQMATAALAEFFQSGVFICKSRFSYGMRRRPSHFKTFFFVHDSFS